MGATAQRERIGWDEINVSLNGTHLFATAPRSIRTREQLVALLALLHERFPTEADHKNDPKKYAGMPQYEIAVNRWHETPCCKRLVVDGEPQPE